MYLRPKFPTLLSLLIAIILTGCGGIEEDIANLLDPDPHNPTQEQDDTDNDNPTSDNPDGTPGTGNHPPTIGGTPNQSVAENELFEFVPIVDDADGDDLSFSTANRPAWLTLDQNGTLRGIPGYDDAGDYPAITLNVSDGQATTTLSFDLTVENVNRAPVFHNVAPTTVTEGELYAFTPVASDDDGDAITFSAKNLPTWLALDHQNGELTGVPNYNDAGAYDNIIIIASDRQANTELNIDLTVFNVNRAPQIGGTPDPSIVEGAAYLFSPHVSDDDGDALTFSVTNNPHWLTINPFTGVLTGTPQSGDAGTYSNITIAVSDGVDSATLAFDLAVCALDDCMPGIPDILYTDVLSGPISGGEFNDGAYLSLFGVNFGTQDALGVTTRVYINDVEVARYVDLGDAKAQVFPQHSMQRLSVQVGDLGNPPLGEPLPITIVVDGVSSDADHTFIAQPGNILYVDNVLGNDATAEINNPDKPFRHIQTSSGVLTGAFGQAKAGDFIVMRGNAPWTDIGSSDRFLRIRYTSGSAPGGVAGTGPITIMGYPGEDVLIECQNNTACGIHGVDGYASPGEGMWITIANLSIRGGNSTVYDGPINLQHKSDYWRVVNTELFDWDAQAQDVYDNNGNQIAWQARAGGITGDGAGVKLLGNYIHDIGGGTLNHGIYIDGGAQDIEIAYNHLENLSGGNIIQLYDSVGLSGGATRIVNADIHHNLMQNGNRYGLNFSSGTHSLRAWNNVIGNTALAGVRFSTAAGSGSGYNSGIQVVHNTLYNVATAPANSTGSAIDNDWNGDGILIMNNIVHASTGANGYYANNGNHANLVLESNLYFNLGDTPPDKDPNPLLGSPFFADAPNGDFHLSAGSAAIDAAATLTEPVAIDFNARPRDASNPDIGAFEYVN